MKLISAADLKQLIESSSIELLDIREPWEHAICNIGGSHVVMHEIPKHPFNWAPNQKVCVICKTGKRAEAAANLLHHQYPQVEFFILDGGITAWYTTFEPFYEMY